MIKITLLIALSICAPAAVPTHAVQPSETTTKRLLSMGVEVDKYWTPCNGFLTFKYFDTDKMNWLDELIFENNVQHQWCLHASHRGAA